MFGKREREMEGEACQLKFSTKMHVSAQNTLKGVGIEKDETYKQRNRKSSRLLSPHMPCFHGTGGERTDREGRSKAGTIAKTFSVPHIMFISGGRGR